MEYGESGTVEKRVCAYVTRKEGSRIIIRRLKAAEMIRPMCNLRPLENDMHTVQSLTECG